MRKLLFFLSFGIFVLISKSSAQTDKQITDKKFALSFDGQIVVATNGDAVFTNFGGPGLRMKPSKSLAFAINMLPSLSFIENAPRPLVTPTLGVGFQLSYKQFILCLPLYYVAPKGSSVQNWTMAFGIGYRLSK
jgi:hypothetical protein